VIDLDPTEEPTQPIRLPGTVTEEITEKIKPVKTGQTTPSLEDVPPETIEKLQERSLNMVEDYCVSEYCQATPMGWIEPTITPFPGVHPVAPPAGGRVPVRPRLPVRVPVPGRLPVPLPGL
jgi:hypothetical protein